ncbi:MAG: NADP-dependent malic enzyme [Candidatus Moranbacteria bacterium]|nr:NADP-dependent malic enzyme [Candidatus Moranbacteria bacterium]
MKNDIQKESLAIHKKLRGKIEITPKAKLTKKSLGLFYTPGVGAVSTHIAEHPEAAMKMTLRGNTVAVVSDGSAVLGLGNIGPLAALPVMEGKAMLFKTLAGVDAFPIVLNTQDPDAIVEIVKALEPSFGAINLEDIAAPQCFEIERRLREALKIPVMHDDQHGTAMVVLSGLINALLVRGSKKNEVRVVVNGAGAAGTAIVQLLLMYGFEHIVMVDSQGAIHNGRKGMSDEKKHLATITNRFCHIDEEHVLCTKGDLRAALFGADVFIGVSKGGILKEDMVRAMNPDPIIFALANPVPEIYPDEAKKAGALVVATGRSDFPNQINNALGFPGIFRGALDHGVTEITDTMLVRAAEKLAGIIKKPTPTMIIPSPFDKSVVKAVSSAIR